MTLTQQKFNDLERDIDDTGKFVNAKKLITPRYGDSFKSAPLIAQELAENGMFQPFKTEAELKANVPIIVPTVGKALDTKKVWIYEQISVAGVKPKVYGWVDTGLSERDLSALDLRDYNNSMTSEKSDLNAVYMFEDADSNVVVVFKKDGNIVTPKANFHDLKVTTDNLNIHSRSIEESSGRVASEDCEALYDFQDKNDVSVVKIDKTGSIIAEFGKVAVNSATMCSASSTKNLYSKEQANVDYLSLNMQRLLLTNTSELSPFFGAFKQQFTIKTPGDFLNLKIIQGDSIPIDTPYYLKNSHQFSNQVVHPFICKFPKSILGFDWIMLITPFHSTNDMYENPCVYGSNDLKKFHLIENFKQPLMSLLPTGFYNYNSDPCCAFDHHTGEFCVISRNTQVINNSNVSKLYLLKTKDFVNWSTPLEIKSTDTLSPTVVYDTNINKWVMFGYKNGSSLTRRVADRLDGLWSDASTITPPFSVWHQEIRFCGGHYIGIFGDNRTQTGGALYLGISTDGITWQFSTDIFKGTHLPAYKPSITHEFVDSTHIKFHIVWTSSDITGVTSEKWKLFSAETATIEVV